MEIIFFTKFLSGLNPEEIGITVKKLGFEGLDIAIRNGHAVNPSNVKEALPKAMVVWRTFSLSVPLATLETSCVDPELPEVEAIFAACADAGIPYVKLGYWHWSPDRRYWDMVDTIREALSKFEKLSAKYGVCTLVHTHSGNCYGSNASGAMHLVRGFDPRHIGVYIDPAHLAVGGEPLPMALGIARDYLKMVAAKNVRYQRSPDGSGKWVTDWCLLSEGLVDWPGALRLLKDVGYDGPITVHGEYSNAEDTATVLSRVEQDMAYLQPHLP